MGETSGSRGPLGSRPRPMVTSTASTGGDREAQRDVSARSHGESRMGSLHDATSPVLPVGPYNDGSEFGRGSLLEAVDRATIRRARATKHGDHRVHGAPEANRHVRILRRRRQVPASSVAALVDLDIVERQKHATVAHVARDVRGGIDNVASGYRVGTPRVSLNAPRSRAADSWRRPGTAQRLVGLARVRSSSRRRHPRLRPPRRTQSR